MDKVRKFRQRARECMELAARAATPELRGHYEDLANTWEKLAIERTTFFIEKPDAQPKPDRGNQAVAVSLFSARPPPTGGR